MSISKKSTEFYNFVFDGLGWIQHSNKYLEIGKRVSDDKSKIVVRVGDNHLIKAPFGYGLVLDRKHIVFLKYWQVSKSVYGNEVVLTKQYFIVKEWGDFDQFCDIKENLNWETWVKVAEEQEEKRTEDDLILFDWH